MDTTLVHAGSADELREKGMHVVHVGGTPVVVIWHADAFHALDNRCPHLGFPLHTGDVDDGLLACHWHHARFDVTCGATLDPWADDADCYGVVERDGEIYVDPTRPPRDACEHGLQRLQRGLEDVLGLVIAKAVVELGSGGVDPLVAVRAGARFGALQRAEGWQPGLSILTGMTNVLPALADVDRQRALFQALRQVAADCQDRAPRRPLPQLTGSGRDAPGLREWLRQTVEVRDADGAERVLATMVREHGPAAALEAVFAACTDHRYSDVGHTLEYAVKCAELVDAIGDDDALAEAMVTSLVPQLVQMQRMEETSAWRTPVDVAAIVDSAWARVPEAAEFGDGVVDRDALAQLILDEDPAASGNALANAACGGASPAALADAVVDAAVIRVLQFGTANETTDWDTVHHTLTYANAVAEAIRRAPSRELFRGVLDGAMSVYLDRFLNVPAARMPPSDASIEDPLAAILDLTDRRARVDDVAAAAQTHLERGGDAHALLATLGTAILREDAGFHSYQQLDVAWRLLERNGDSPAGHRALVAAARWIAAQFPTRRAREQTFSIAQRLHRGDTLFS